MASPLQPSTDSHGHLAGGESRFPAALGYTEEVERVFRHFDANGDGKISASELAGVVRSQAGGVVSDEEIHGMMEEMDADRDGFVDLAEFHRGGGSRGRKGGEGDREGELWDAFRMYDLDGDGLISPGELQQVLGKLGDECSVRDSSRMIGSVDADGDGGIRFEEFKKMMTSGNNGGGGGDRNRQPNQEHS